MTNLASSKRTESLPSTWVEMTVEYGEDLRRLDKYRNRPKENITSWDSFVYEVTGSMRNDVAEMVRILKNKALYDYEAYRPEDVERYPLTDKQKEVLLLRLKYTSYTKIASILGKDVSTVFRLYKTALNKLCKYKEQERAGVVIGLSPQQEKIYKMYQQGKTRKEMAEALDLSINSIKTQLKRIKAKEQRG